MFRDYIVMDLDVVIPGDMGRGKKNFLFGSYIRSLF